MLKAQQEKQQAKETSLEYLNFCTTGDTNLAGTNKISYSHTFPLSNNSDCLHHNSGKEEYFNYEEEEEFTLSLNT